MPLNITGNVNQNLTWTNFKSIAITAKSLSVQYYDDGYTYTIWAFDGLVVYETLIYQGTVPDSVINSGYSQAQNNADKTDFTTNYQPTSNKNITPAVKQASAVPSATDPALVVTMSPNAATLSVGADLQSGSYPDPGSHDTATTTPLLEDAFGNLQTRGPVLSDEGSVRDDFVGSALTTSLTGTVTFTASSTAITGSGTSFTTQVTTNSYIKKSADSETLYVRVASIESDTALTLESAYGGTTSSTTAVVSNWKTSVTGGSITVTNSEVQLASSTANGNSVQIVHQGDYLPFTLNFRARITQRIANQTSIIGFQDVPGSATQQAVVVFDGTSNTSIKFRTSASAAAADIQETVVNLQTGLDTSQTLLYEIDLENDVAVLSINGNIVASHQNHLPQPYTNMAIMSSIANSAVVTTTTLAMDLVFFSNVDSLQINNTFAGDPLRVTLVSGTTTTNGISFGDISLSAVVSNTAVRRTTYTEQTTNFTGSVVSSSASDAAAGTGARTVLITYYDQTGAGPFTETVTLNGTSAVNLVSTNHCFIEKMVVVTVGSTASNVGTITLKTGAAGAGTTVGTIAATDNSTFWAHHYVPSGKTTSVTSISVSVNGGAGQFFIRYLPIGVANAAELQISDVVREAAQAATSTRVYGTPIKIAGPARLLCYVTTEANTSLTYRAAFDFTES